jgi:hypothetical protein
LLIPRSTILSIRGLKVDGSADPNSRALGAVAIPADDREVRARPGQA